MAGGNALEMPGCGDRTLRTEEFLEGLRRAELYLQRQQELQQREGGTSRRGISAGLRMAGEGFGADAGL